MRPLLKWAGGKRSLVERILGLFPEDHRSRAFHEPFFGGGAVFFRLEPEAGSINDVNARLMNFYRVVRDSPTNSLRPPRSMSMMRKSTTGSGTGSTSGPLTPSRTRPSSCTSTRLATTASTG